jgi:hypothetical protein
MTHIALNTTINNMFSMETIKKVPTEKKYREMKSLCNLYERTWRKRNPAKHKLASKKLLKTMGAK